MNETEYKAKLKAIEDEAEQKRRKLHREYALANNPYKVGDVVTDHIGTLRIEQIVITLDIKRLPTCYFRGVELKKNGMPKARQKDYRTVWQQNIIKDVKDEISKP